MGNYRLGDKGMKGTHAHVTRLKSDGSDYYRSCCPYFERFFCERFAEPCSHLKQCDYFDKNFGYVKKEKKSKPAQKKAASSDVQEDPFLTVKPARRKSSWKQAKRETDKARNRSADNIVDFEDSVKLLDIEDNEFFTVKLSGKKGNSSNPNIITTGHPLGRTLYKKRKGDTVSIELPNGSARKIKIVNIIKS